MNAPARWIIWLAWSACWLAEGSAWAWEVDQLDIVPTPRQCLASGVQSTLGRDAKIAINVGQETPILRTARDVLVGFFRRQGAWHFVTSQSARHLAPSPDAALTILLRRADAQVKPQGYLLRISGNVVTISGGDDAGTLYGVYTFLKTLRFTPEGMVVRELQISDEPALQVRGLSPQWAWYIGERAPYGEALWGLERWKVALDFMAEYRFNMLALCTYGKFPFPLENYRSRCAVDLPFDLWNPTQGNHTICWTHPAFKEDFLGALVEYAHARGIRLLIYSCLNLQDEIGSHQWTNEEEIKTYCDIQQHLLRRYGIDGFIFESGEFHVMRPDDLARFGNDEWTRLRADIFLTRRYTEAIRAAKPDAVIGLVDHYLFNDWDEKKVRQREGLERWKAELPPEALIAYVHSPEAYEVFPPNRIWTYVFGPKGGLKPAIQLHLADFCDVPRQKRVAGAYYVTYDWIPHEPDYLSFAESAWGNYGGTDKDGFVMHSSERGVGGPISGRVWKNIKREFYGEGAEFGEGLLTAAKGTFRNMWDVAPALHKMASDRLVPALDEGRFDEAETALAELRVQRAFTEKGLSEMLSQRDHAAPTMISQYPIKEHLDKAVLLAQVQLAWTEFVEKYHQTILHLARKPEDEGDCKRALNDLRTAATSSHARIRECLSKAYFSYPHDKLGRFEFLANPDPLLADMAKLRIRFSLQTGPAGKRFRLHNVAPQAEVIADSNFPSPYGPGYYEPRFAADGKKGAPNKGIWVSAETQEPHFLELRFPNPVTVRGVVVHWAYDEAHDWTPQDFSIQAYVSASGGGWKPLLQVKNNREPIAVAKSELPARLARVQIVITRGSPSRPHLAAVNEIEVLAIIEGERANE